MSCDCCVALPRGAMELSAVCDCGLSLSYSPTIYVFNFMCGLCFLNVLMSLPYGSMGWCVVVVFPGRAH